MNAFAALTTKVNTIKNQILVALLLTTGGAATAQTAPAKATSHLDYSASAAAKETFDNNVFLQDLGPSANKESLITTLIPSVGVTYKGSDAFGVALSYAPEVNIFHSAASEDFVLHRAGLTFSGKSDKTAWELANSLILIDGDDQGLIYLAPGDVPAAGGPAIRDRRDAAIYRSGFKITQSFKNWFIRPNVTAYVHDFQTVQKTTAGYLNFVDRNDINGGVDVGYNVGKDTFAVVGYRYGQQGQAQLFPAINATHYDNSYHRVLFGVEGKLLSWLKLNLSLGPEFRTYDNGVAATFRDKERTYLYADSSVIITPGKLDTITLSAKRYEQPGFSGRSTYDDSTYSINWTHKLTDKLTVGVGGRAYNTDFLYPAVRNDWILSGNALVSYLFTKQFSGEISYGYDDAQSEVPNKPGREYSRHFVALGLKYVFK